MPNGILKNRIWGSGTLLPTFHNCLVYLEFQGFSIKVICTIDGFETNKKPGNQFQNKSLKAIQAILEYIWSSLFNASSPIKVYPWKKIIDQKITPTLLRKSKHFFLLMTKHNFLQNVDFQSRYRAFSFLSDFNAKWNDSVDSLYPGPRFVSTVAWVYRTCARFSKDLDESHREG